MTTIEEWNERYRTGETEEGSPTPVVARAAALSSPGRALDLACGAGRNALFLARNGWTVVALDGAAEAIRILKEKTAEYGLAIEAAVADLERDPIPYPDESFELVVITHYLQRDLFPRAASLLTAGGLCAVAIRLADASAGARKHRYRLKPGELRQLFDGWKVVDYREEDGIAEIIARRAAVLS
jgi:tellurite methyltransferase